MLVKIPCGLYYEDVLYNYAEVDELSGQQQEYLMRFDDEDTSTTLDHIPLILDDLILEFKSEEGQVCTLSAKDIYWKLPLEDLYIILVKIRELTWGYMYVLPVECSSCGKIQEKKVDLTTIEVSYPDDPKKMEKTIHLEKADIDVVVKPIYLQDMMKFEREIRTNRTNMKNFNVLAKQRQLSVKSLGDNTSVTESDLLKLKLSDLKQIDDTENVAGSVNLELDDCKCTRCDLKIYAALPVTSPLFFGQSQTPITGYPVTILTIAQT